MTPRVCRMIGGRTQAELGAHLSLMDTNPFSDPLESRSVARRFRGRLAAPVTIWTSGPPEARTGLTVSSLVVADGEPPLVLGLINDTTSLYDTIVDSGSFVVHVAEEHQQRMSEVFAGLRPSPGGMFTSVGFHDGPYGPVLDDLAVRAFCRLDDVSRAGSHHVISGRIEEASLGQPLAPLVRFRGRYRELSD